jgi:hypothetical protein
MWQWRMTWQNLLTWLLTQMLSRVVTCRWRGWWCRYLWWHGRLCGAAVVGLIIFGSLCFCLPYLLWSVAAAVSDGARNGALWFCLELVVLGKRWQCLWCRCWTWPVDPVSLLKVRHYGWWRCGWCYYWGCSWWRWWVVTLIWNRRHRAAVAAALRGLTSDARWWLDGRPVNGVESGLL